ncbi:hypothetical protein [Leucobacter chromiiresistens]|uniref:Large exoprotein n=3 Tax=Leucobacter chromiiresistens TaxID=1079994 RepID=A0A1H1B8V0_9MICO|nr:hypothetical protein [Leucobacter chromiiresistens]SDQ48408.1 hypothetical protein SAMN04488565_2661 [Leucobacter chromiiresistens]
MTGGVLGGGVIFVIAALLWGAVLVPNWARRREFRAAEKNALRLQRTLRLLAETTEVPQEVRLEATAREALAHERLLRSAQKRQDAERRAALAEAEAEQVRAEIRARQMQRKQAAVERSAKLRRPVARRVRATAALGALLGLVGLLVGAGFAIGGSGASLLIGAALLFAASSGALVLLAPGRARVRAVPAEQVTSAIATAVVESAPQHVAAPDTASEAAAAAAHAEAQRAAAERIELARARARARAERPAPQENQTDSMLLREVRKQLAQAAEAAPDPRAAAASAAAEEQARQQAQAADEARVREQARQRELRAQQQEASNRLRSMGVVGDTAAGMPDLDAVLRRRRNAG